MAVVPRSLRFTLFGVLAGLCTCGVALAAGTTLYSFLLRSHEQPGFTIEKGSRITLKTASAYVKWAGYTGQQATKYVQTLRAESFERAVDEQLKGKAGKAGFSLVVKFRHRAGARQFKGVLLNGAKQANAGATITSFSVPGIRNARGMTATANQVAVANVYWTEGRCTFGSGLFLPAGGTLSPGKIAAPVIKGARSQHTRTGGKCPA